MQECDADDSKDCKTDDRARYYKKSVTENSPPGTCPECTIGRCPYYGDRENDCHGMCGKCCSCWEFICGDCCVHQGCLDHDNCCARDGYMSRSCLLVYGFSCSGYTC